MDAWVLAAIVCSATPQPDGSYCTTKALDYGISREVCQAERQRWSGRFPHTRLECTEDPQLVTLLKAQDDVNFLAGERAYSAGNYKLAADYYSLPCHFSQ